MSTTEQIRSGYIAVYRSLLEHPLMNQLPAAWFRVFIAILLKANWRPGRWWNGHHEVTIPPGSFVTSVDKLRRISKVSAMQVRGCLEYLKAANIAAIETTRQYTLITVLNWQTHQNSEDSHNEARSEPKNELATNRQQSSNKAVTTIREGNQGIIEERKKTTLIDYSDISLKNRAKMPESAGSVCSEPSEQDKLRRTLTEYFGSVPDAPTLGAIVNALEGSPIPGFIRYLDQMPAQYRGGVKAGPKTWGWFISTARSYHGMRTSQAQPGGLTRAEFNRMTDAIEIPEAIQ